MSVAKADRRSRTGTLRATLHGQQVRARFEGARRTIAVAVVGVLLSLIASVAVGRWESSVSHAKFAGAAQVQAIVLQNGVNEYLNRLVALKTLFESTNRNVTRNEFEVFINRLFEDRPGLFRVNWLPRVTRSERAQYEKAAVDDGIVGYHFRSLGPDGKTITAPESDEYYPVYYSTEPKTAAIYGFDVASDPVRRAVTERARDNDAIATLAVHRRYVQPGNPQGVVVSIPVYAKDAPRESLDDRRHNATGLISGVFELTRLLRAVLATTAPSSDVDLFVHTADGSVIAQSTPDSVPWSSSSRPVQTLIDAVGGTPAWSGSLQIGDASWRLSSKPTAGGRLDERLDGALFVLLGGLVLTAILVAYTSFSHRHHRAVELALTDALTGLANRRAFFARLDSVLATARHSGGEKGFTVLYFDLDRFKEVNDMLGHGAGDELLHQVADRLRAILRKGDLGARFGGDEFAVLQHDGADAVSADALARRIGEAIAEPYAINDAVVHVTASIGIARSAPEVDADSILMQADLALYRAKEDGRNCWRFHGDELDRQVRERALLADELRGAIDRGELELYYQPQVELASGRVLGLEALLRWHHPTRGQVSPALFIPIAERNGSILQIGRWVFDQACRQYRAWADDGIAPAVLAVNLSDVQFKATLDLAAEMERSLTHWRIPHDHMEVEISESVFLEASQCSGGTLAKLRHAGLRIALAGFGTGYSSLNHLARYPVNRLKMSQQIVAGLASEPRHAVVLRAALRLGLELGIEVLAEGVETPAQAGLLRACGCEQAQGFHFGVPAPAAQTTALLRGAGNDAAVAQGEHSLTAA